MGELHIVKYEEKERKTLNERKTLFIFEFKMNVLTFSAIFCPALIAGFSKIGRF